MYSRIVIILFVILNVGCLKQSNELPPLTMNHDPGLPVNFQLSRLHALLPPEGAPVLLDSDWTAACIVRADDASGNFHNQLVLEDSTAGISVLLNEGSLYTRYPTGSKVYLKLRGLYLGNDHGNPYLGGIPAPDNAGVLQVSDVPARSLTTILIPAGTAPEMLPLVQDLAQLQTPHPELTGRLIRLNGVELADPDHDDRYADPGSATSIRLQNCAGEGIILRSSNYASFQPVATPGGNGTITAIYSIYKGAGQLSIRDTNDVSMKGIRCDGTIPRDPDLISIATLREVYHGKDTVLGNFRIRGVVTSDAVHKNFNSGTIILQQGGKAIAIFFGTSVTGLPDLGDSIELKVSGATLTRYNDALEVKNVSPGKVKILAQNVSVNAVTLSIAALNASFSAYENVLVRIAGGKISGTGKYAGAHTLSDSGGSITLYTSSSATFANEPIPTITKTFQGIATPYGTTKEIKIRYPDIDVY